MKKYLDNIPKKGDIYEKRYYIIKTFNDTSAPYLYSSVDLISGVVTVLYIFQDDDGKEKSEKRYYPGTGWYIKRTEIPPNPNPPDLTIEYIPGDLYKNRYMILNEISDNTRIYYAYDINKEENAILVLGGREDVEDVIPFDHRDLI